MIKAVVFDMDGVIRIGQHPIKGVNETIEYLTKKGIRGMISTNECRYTENEICTDLGELGINIPDNWEIYTASMAVRDYLEKKIVNNPDKNFSIGIVGCAGLYEKISELTTHKNCEITKIPPKYETRLYLVIGTVDKMKIAYLEKCLKWVKADSKVITTCPDIADPSSKGDDMCVGMPNHTIHLLNYNSCIKPYSLGKPHPIHARKIRETFPDLKDEEILFVGDTIYTDIYLAEENNFKSCLVLTGNTKKEFLKNYVVEPDYVVDSIANIKDILEG